MAELQEPRNALWRREDQLKRWNLSETNKESAERKDKSKTKVQFQDGCVFLAACASGDKGEVEKLLARGADINTANVDGLTALHQACIDDNVDMVKFLVEHGADIDACDNEGWTPLHATASCGVLDIAKYLIDKGANVAAVNIDGELPLDIAEGDDMDQMLCDEMERLGIDGDSARREEEELMERDAMQWINSGKTEDSPHPKTGATALHVASSKGYTKVMNLLLNAKVDIDAKDVDGWTPLHAAAHWGQEEACRILVENFCNMEVKNQVGQTAVDICEPNLLNVLGDLKVKQASLKKDRESSMKDPIMSRNPPPLKRRSSVTRMSVDQKQSVIMKNMEEERAQLEEHIKKATFIEKDEDVVEEKKSVSSNSEDSNSESDETEKQNEINSRQSTIAKTEDDETPLVRPGVDIGSPKIEDAEEEEEKTEESSEESEGTSGSKESSPEATSPEVTSPEETSPVITTPPAPGGASTAPLPSPGPTPSSALSISDIARTQQQQEANKENKEQNVIDDKQTRKVDDATRIADEDTSRRRPFSTPVIGETQTQDEKNRRQIEAENARAAITSTTTRPNTISTVSSLSSLSTKNTTSSTAPGRRSVMTYEPAKRDEERETERKAKAKRARETRRSTQGVTREDIQRAEQTLQAAKEGKEPPSDPVRGIIDEKDKENQPDDVLLRHRRIEDKDDSRSSYRRIRDSALSPDTSLGDSRMSDLSSTLGSTNIPTSGRQSYGSRKDEPDTSKRDDDKDKEKEDPSQKSAAIRNRRKRESRRPTGRVNLDDLHGINRENSEESNKDGEEQKEEEDKTSLRYGLSRYSDPAGSSYERPSSLHSSRTDRPYSSYTPTTRSSSTTSLEKDMDYKKLYEDEKAENERLRKELKKSQTDLDDVKVEVTSLRSKNDSSRSMAESADKRERRALERRISELEEEVKVMENLKTENLKLKEENGALIRVISKLSK